MLAVSVALFLVLRPRLGVWPSAGIALLFHLTWMAFNYWQATTVTFRTVLRTYFLGRQRGLSESEALRYVIDTRYFRDSRMRQEFHERILPSVEVGSTARFLEKLNEVRPSADQRIRMLTFHVWAEENRSASNRADFKMLDEMTRKIEREYSRLSQKFPTA